jgi:hypothetical protein
MEVVRFLPGGAKQALWDVVTGEAGERSRLAYSVLFE